MIEIIINFIDLFKIAFNELFNLQVELVNGEPISVGMIFIAFVLFVGIIYLIFKYALGIGKGDD